MVPGALSGAPAYPHCNYKLEAVPMTLTKKHIAVLNRFDFEVPPVGVLDAGTSLTTGASVSADLFTALTEGNNALKLVLAVAGGLALCLLSNRIDSPWVLPIMAVLFVATFYGGVGLAGATRGELVNGGWLPFGL